MFDQVENLQMFLRLPGQPAAVDGDVIFDKPAQAVDTSDRIQENSFCEQATSIS